MAAESAGPGPEHIEYDSCIAPVSTFQRVFVGSCAVFKRLGLIYGIVSSSCFCLQFF